MLRSLIAAAVLLAAGAAGAQSWPEIEQKARGQTVYWNAWAGDERTNAFIAWTNDQVSKRYGVKVEQVKLRAAQAGREAFERDEAAQKQAAEEFAAMPR